jgi:hypothetical protein
MQHHDADQHGRSMAAHAARLASAGLMASWFAWQLIVLRGHIPL